MKPKTIFILLIATISFTGLLGVMTIFNLNKLLQVSHQSTYTKEEEIRIYDEIQKMASNSEISQSDIIRIVESQKKQRSAAYKIMAGSQKTSTKMNATFIVLIAFQIVLLIYYVKKSNEKQ